MKYNIYKKVLSIILIISIISTYCFSKLIVITTFAEEKIENFEISEFEVDEMDIQNFDIEEFEIVEMEIIDNKVIETLRDDELIDEVVSCQTIYVNQDNIDEFSRNSQISKLFNNINISSVLKKIALGTGVIVTVAIVKKTGSSELIASVVTKALDDSINFAKAGAGIGGMYGATSGALDEIDKPGRLSAILGLATAIAGLIITATSLIATLPTGGLSALKTPAGIKLVVAGIETAATAIGTKNAAENIIKKYKVADSNKIDWENIDWKKVGLSSVEKSIENAANGYLCGAIVGAINGGVEEYYEKFNTPYSQYIDRYKQTPINKGKWTGERGESEFVLDEKIVLNDGTKVTKCTYRNCQPDFSPFEVAKVDIKHMSSTRHGQGNNFEQADEALAKIWTKNKFKNIKWEGRDVENYRAVNNLVWHEMSNMKSMQLVDKKINSTFGHSGGCYECAIKESYKTNISGKGNVDNVFE